MPPTRSLATLPIHLVLGFLSGCGACDGEDEAREQGAAASTEGREATSPDIDEEASSDPPEHVEILAAPNRYGEVELRIRIHEGASVALSTEAQVERRGGDESFAPLEGVALSLVNACDEEATPRCVTLIPGAELSPPPFTGKRGQSQCECRGCPPHPPGTYRVVLTTCDGEHTVASAPFTLRTPVP